MPGVEVFSRVLMDPRPADVLKQTVRAFGADHFSAGELQLSEKDFSFKFHQPVGRLDELTSDVIVRIRLHDTPERRAQLNLDEEARLLARLIGTGIVEFYSYPADFNVGVELSFADVGWGTSG